MRRLGYYDSMTMLLFRLLDMMTGRPKWQLLRRPLSIFCPLLTEQILRPLLVRHINLAHIPMAEKQTTCIPFFRAVQLNSLGLTR